MSDIENKLIALAASAAYAAVYEDEEGVLPETPEEVEAGGAFVIPLVLPINRESGDGRKVVANGELSLRDLPLPLLWQPKTGSGHDGSFIIGRIDSCEIDEEGNVVNARGVFDTGPYGREAERLVRNNMLRGTSADLDMFEVLDEEEMAQLAADSEEDLNSKLYIKKARIMGVTALPKPAFQECTINLADDSEEIPIVDGVHQAEVELTDDPETVVSTLIASAIPVHPPRSWFDNPKLEQETPITVDDEGHVYGHIATWAQDHIGFNYGVRPPRSKSNYQYFHTGVVRTDDETDVTVGQLTLAGGHADLSASANDAIKHYDDTASAIADVHAGEDSYGIWVSGALRPSATPEQIRTLRASAPSGDWRPINGRLELVAVCQVNVPGFPVARACVASGVVTSLVAAGAAGLYKMRTDNVNNLATRLDTLEREALKAQREAALLRVKPIEDAKHEALVAAAEELKARFAPEFEARDKRRAELAAKAAELDNRVSEFKIHVSSRVNPDWDESKHPRDRYGKWREVLFKLSDLLGGKDDTHVTEALTRAAEAEESGDTGKAAEAGEAAKEALIEAVQKSDDEAVKGRLGEAIEDVSKAIKDQDSGDAAPQQRSEPEVETALEAGLKALAQQLIDELAEKADIKRIAEAEIARLMRYVNEQGLTSPEELAKIIAAILEKKFTPGIAQ